MGKILVGVVGTGVMGLGIVRAFASHGIPVIVYGRKESSLKKGLIYLDKKDKKLLKFITPTSAISDLAYCDLVVELGPDQKQFCFFYPGAGHEGEITDGDFGYPVVRILFRWLGVLFYFFEEITQSFSGFTMGVNKGSVVDIP